MAKRIRDASTPRTLYVRCDVLNSGDIKAWAKEQGFTTSLDDMHVTVIYSKTAVDWLKIGLEEWGSNEDGILSIRAGGPRVIENFGDGAIVLASSNSYLPYRNMRAREEGAMSDHDDYTPHITITYQPPASLDLSQVQPDRLNSAPRSSRKSRAGASSPRRNWSREYGARVLDKHGHCGVERKFNHRIK